MNPYAGLRKEDVELRENALREFAEWEETHGSDLPPGVALEGVGLIWELLPEDSRQRGVDPSGVQRMHDRLRHLTPSR